MANKRVSYTEVPPSFVSDAELKHHAQLFSSHYGKWGENPHGLQKGARVRLTASRLRSDHLFDEQRCSLIRATISEGETVHVVGHACVYCYEVPGKGKVSWITQLVVHSDYRHRGVAKKLCRMAWPVEQFYAVGLVTSHPYAVRALERATQRTCNRATIMPVARELLSQCNIPYVLDKALCFEEGRCLIDTQFFVDHTDVNNILATTLDTEWELGGLEDGKEFFAFTFAASPNTCLPLPS
ncbi:hypothetical protein V8C86DRAFT_2543878 [Haematococcus lacustris]